MTYIYQLKGIDCANCAAKMERKINAVKGVEEATLNFMTQKLYMETSLAPEDAQAAIQKAVDSVDEGVEVKRIK